MFACVCVCTGLHWSVKERTRGRGRGEEEGGGPSQLSLMNLGEELVCGDPMLHEDGVRERAIKPGEITEVLVWLGWQLNIRQHGLQTALGIQEIGLQLVHGELTQTCAQCLQVH